MFSKKATPQFRASDCYPETVYTPKSLGFQDSLFSNHGLAKYHKDRLWAMLAEGSREARQASDYLIINKDLMSPNSKLLNNSEQKKKKGKYVLPKAWLRLSSI